MSILNGLLAELGLADPEMHPEREAAHDTDWIIDRPFNPEPGQCYEVAFGKVVLQGREVYSRARIRIEGQMPSQWYDLDHDNWLAPELQSYPVRAFRPISPAAGSSSSH